MNKLLIRGWTQEDIEYFLPSHARFCYVRDSEVEAIEKSPYWGHRKSAAEVLSNQELFAKKTADFKKLPEPGSISVEAGVYYGHKVDAKKHYSIFTDGSYSRIGQKEITTIAGWITDGQNVVLEFSKEIPKTTASELSAVAEAVRLAKSIGIDSYTVYSDSKGDMEVLDQLSSGIYQERYAKNPQLYKSLYGGEFCYIPRSLNTYADRLSKIPADALKSRVRTQLAGGNLEVEGVGTYLALGSNTPLDSGHYFTYHNRYYYHLLIDAESITVLGKLKVSSILMPNLLNLFIAQQVGSMKQLNLLLPKCELSAILSQTIPITNDTYRTLADSLKKLDIFNWCEVSDDLKLRVEAYINPKKVKNEFK